MAAILNDRHEASLPFPSITLPGEEPAFRVSRQRGLRLPRRERNPLSASYLAQRVARAPADLLAHVQRIYLQLDLNDRRGVYAALADLFIALGSRGTPLRSRLLDRVMPLLAPEDHRVLSEALERPLEPRSRLGVCPDSVLTRGLIGEWSLVERPDAGRESGQDVLEEATMLLQEGAVEAATQLLETAVASDPGRAEPLQLLLDIYRRTREVERFTATYERLLANGQNLPNDWLGLAADLADETS